MKYHPQRNKVDVAANAKKFSEISEAYEVLTDPSKKAVYDTMGEAALKEGPLYYKYANNALEIFEKFYASYNPFCDLIDSIFNIENIATGERLQGSMFGSAYGGARQPSAAAPNDLVVDCICSLEELYSGCIKDITYERSVLGLDGRSLKKQTEKICVEIKPGYGEDTVLRFPGKGNEGCSYPNCNS